MTTRERLAGHFIYQQEQQERPRFSSRLLVRQTARHLLAVHLMVHCYAGLAVFLCVEGCDHGDWDYVPWGHDEWHYDYACAHSCDCGSFLCSFLCWHSVSPGCAFAQDCGCAFAQDCGCD